MNKEAVCRSKMSFSKRSLSAYYALTYGNSPYRCSVCSQWHLTSKNEEGAQHFARLMLLRTLRSLCREKAGLQQKHRKIFR